jgi:hypothetical protein
VDGLRKRFTLLQALGNDPERQNSCAGHRFAALPTVRQDPGQLRDLSYPAPIVFHFRFDREVHGRLLAVVNIAEI